MQNVENFVNSVLFPLASRSTVFVIPILEDACASLSKSAAIEVNALKMIIALFMTLPLALFARIVPLGVARITFDLMVGIMLTQFALGPDWVHIFVSGIVTWLILKLWPKSSSHLVGFTWSILYMSVCHLYMMYANYMFSKLDFTGLQMIVTIKLSSICFNYYDGTHSPTPKELENPKFKRVLDERASLSISKVPNLLSFFAYLYNPLTTIAGPAFEYRHYIDIVTGKCDRIFSLSLIGGYLMIGFLTLVAHVTIYPQIPIQYLNNPEYYTKPLIFRCLYAYASLFLIRCKFYGVWFISSSSSAMAGYHQQYIESMDIMGFEWPKDVKGAIKSWNIRTQTWLLRYVYLRSKSNLVLTFFVSAVWHGFYPGFYLFFLSYPLVTIVERLADAWLNAHGMATRILTIIIMNYLAIVFQIYKLNESVEIWWKSFGCVPHVVLIIAAVALTMTRKNDDDKKKAS